MVVVVRLGALFNFAADVIKKTLWVAGPIFGVGVGVELVLVLVLPPSLEANTGPS